MAKQSSGNKRKRKPRVGGSEVSHPSKAAEEFARAKRRHAVAQLYLKGYSQGMIAEETKVSAQTVAKDLKVVMESWVKESRLAFEERKAKELAKIDQVEQLAHRGWEASIERQEVHRSLKKTVRQQVRDSENKVVGHKMVPVEQVEETVVKGQSGDPRFLDIISHCVEMRLRILGLWKGDVAVNNQVVLDWTALFKAQAEEAARRQDEHEARRLGYNKLAPRPVTVVDSVPEGVGDGRDDGASAESGDPEDEGAGSRAPGGAGERHHRAGSRGGRRGTPPGIPPENSTGSGSDAIEDRLAREERDLGIKLPDTPV